MLLYTCYRIFTQQSFCGAKRLHRRSERAVHWQRYGPALSVLASSVWVRCTAAESVPTEPYPHQPAGGSRGTGPAWHAHAHRGWVNNTSFDRTDPRSLKINFGHFFVLTEVICLCSVMF